MYMLPAPVQLGCPTPYASLRCTNYVDMQHELMHVFQNDFPACTVVCMLLLADRQQVSSSALRLCRALSSPLSRNWLQNIVRLSLVTVVVEWRVVSKPV